MDKIEPEYIPDGDLLFYRIHINNFRQTEHKIPKGRIVHPNIFEFRGGNLSVDWSAYSSPCRLRERASEPEKME